jgi:hypothetical protein
VNKQETAQLLAWMQGVDGRVLNELSVLAWHQVVGDLDYDAALDAVREHYREESRYVMPADVVARCNVGPEYGLDETQKMLEESRRRWLTLAGISEAQLDAALAAGNHAVIMAWDAKVDQARGVTRG